MEEDIPFKQNSKESWSSNTHIRKKMYFKIKRQRKTFHNDQKINPRRNNDCKYRRTQHSSTSMYKANGLKRRNPQ